MNTVNLVGRLTRDVVVRQTKQTGKNVASFSLAVKRPFSGGNQTDFFNCIAWDKVAEALSVHTQKGDLIGITGYIYVRKYTDKTGAEHTVTEVNARQIEFFPNGRSSSKNYTGNSGMRNSLNDEFGDIDGEEDDLPF